MATVHHFIPTDSEYYTILQQRNNQAENIRLKRFKAIMILQRLLRRYQIQKYVALLNRNCLTIQCAFRIHRAKKAYRTALRRAVRFKLKKYYDKAAIRIQTYWRGYYSRCVNFNYFAYRRWLAKVCERGEKKKEEANQFGIQSHIENSKILEKEATEWLAFVVFKLHHLLRTAAQAGIYSDDASNELTHFENLLKSINYIPYMKKLKEKYKQYVRDKKPKFSNKHYFPIIGDGADYWYLSLPEMYAITAPISQRQKNTRFQDTHHGPIHPKPFLWKKYRPEPFVDQEIRGPQLPAKKIVSAPAPTPNSLSFNKQIKDPRFHLYQKHYKPQANLLDYVDFHVNALLSRKMSTETCSD